MLSIASTSPVPGRNAFLFPSGGDEESQSGNQTAKGDWGFSGIWELRMNCVKNRGFVVLCFPFDILVYIFIKGIGGNLLERVI